MQYKVKQLESGLFAVMQYASDERCLCKVCECYYERFAISIAKSLNKDGL